MVARVSSPTFIGRRSELARFDAALARAIAGEPALVEVAGEAGIGKTRFLAEATARARAAGARVLVGGCVSLGGDGLPFGPFVEAIRRLRADVDSPDITQLAGTLGPDANQGMSDARSTSMRFEGVLRLLRRLAEDAPLVVVLEDLHWADRSTLELIAFLARNLVDVPIALVLSHRMADVDPDPRLRWLLAELERGGRLERLLLAAFDRAELAAQVDAILGSHASSGSIVRIHDRSDGNPFLVEELLAAGQHVGGIASSLRGLLLLRFDGLEPHVKDVVRICAVGGPHATLEVLAALTRDRNVLRDLRRAVEVHVLVPREHPEADGFDFRHALVREAVYAELLPAERRRLHRSFAETLSQRQSPESRASGAAALAYHWHEAGDLPRAFDASVEAGLAADDLYALADACVNYQRAAALWDQIPDAGSRSPLDRVDLLMRAAADGAETSAESISLMREAVNLVDPVADPMRAGFVRSYLSSLLVVGLDDISAVEVAREAIRLIPPDPPTLAGARGLFSYGSTLSYLDHHEESARLCEEALDVAGRADAGLGVAESAARAVADRAQTGLAISARRIRSAALDALAGDRAALGDLEGGLELFAHARRIADEHGYVTRVNESLIWEAIVSFEAGRLDDALRRSLAAREHGTRHGYRSFEWAALFCAAVTNHALGRWDAAVRCLEEARWSQAGLSPLAEFHLDEAQAAMEVARGAFDAASQRLERLVPLLSRVLSAGRIAGVTRALAELALWLGDAPRARATVDRFIERIAAPPDGWVGNLGSVCALGLRAEGDIAARARSARDDTGLADAQGRGDDLLARMRALATDVERRRPIFLPQAAAWLATCEAEHARLRQQQDEAGRWTAAAAAWGGLRMPYPEAYARWREAARLISNHHEPARAKATLETALRTARDLGAEPLQRELEDLAKRGGIALGSDRSALAPAKRSEGRHRLTDRELEVLGLVAAGRSDADIAGRLYISKKTASVHVANIKGKLGADSRVGIVTTAIRLGLVAPPSANKPSI